MASLSPPRPNNQGNDEDDEALTRTLRLGDLVRVSNAGRFEDRRLKDRETALGRVKGVFDADNQPITNTEATPPAWFTVEWIVATGTTPRIPRHHLRHTTAAAEGMLEDGTRQRNRRGRNRQQQTQQLPAATSNREQTKSSNTSEEQSNATAESINKPKAAKPKAPARKRPPSASSKRKRPAKGSSTTTNNSKSSKQSVDRTADDRKGTRKRPPSESTNATTEPPGTPPSHALDLYEKHRREFDRILGRLEKIDPYGWFFDEAPSDWEENYDASTAEKDSNDGKAAVAQTASLESENGEQPGHSGNLEQSGGSKFPNHAPYNWRIIRKRCEAGRYVIDRVAQEKNERMVLMGPYYRWKGKRPRQRNDSSSSSIGRVFHPKGVNWELFGRDVLAMIDAAFQRCGDPELGGCSSLATAAKKVRERVVQTVEQTGKKQDREMRYHDDRKRFDHLLKHQNGQAAMQSWRPKPYPERQYERLSEDKVCAGLSALDKRIASYELRTNLPDSFVGISYRYDDTGQSEAWMKTVIDEKEGNAKKNSASKKERQAMLAMAGDEGVTRAQVTATMQSLLIQVQDRVMTQGSVLHQPELRSANWLSSEQQGRTWSGEGIDVGNPTSQAVDEKSTTCHPVDEKPEIVEQPVWGIDCYTRMNITTCLESEFDHETALTFVEKWLLPAINACPPAIGHDIVNAARFLEGLPFQLPQESETPSVEIETPASSVHEWTHTLLGNALAEKIQNAAPPWLKACANILRRARESLGPDFFRVHPKGHGSVMLSKSVKPNTLVTFYRGEIYPAWRWCEKMDAIDITQKRKSLKPALPDFYNMALERPQSDPRGYGILIVDASRKGGHGSSLSHSCHPTCEVRVAALNGGLCLAMTTLRELEMGEELTFNYNAATDSLIEYRSAVCLCGYGKCRGSFLHFATADCYQQVLNRNAPMASRFANLIKGSTKKIMSEEDERVLQSHGFKTAAFGAISVNRKTSSTTDGAALSDSLDFVPVWLKTYVADVLRYIEYERRALPIALICNQTSKDGGESEEVAAVVPERKMKEPTKPSPFSYFARKNSEKIQTALEKQGVKSLPPAERREAKSKVAMAYWDSLAQGTRDWWKQEAMTEYERRRKEWMAHQKKVKKVVTKNNTTDKSQSKSSKSGKRGEQQPTPPPKMEFEEADAEGISAMEQRIQQLTHTLSRVGRVLDRHREDHIAVHSNVDRTNSNNLRDAVPPPLAVLKDDDVIDWIWNANDGLVLSTIRCISQARCVRSSMKPRLEDIRDKYSSLERCTSPHSVVETEIRMGRRDLNEALLQMRQLILDELQDMSKEFKKFKIPTKGNVNGDEQIRSTTDGVRSDDEGQLVDHAVDETVVEGNGEKDPNTSAPMFPRGETQSPDHQIQRESIDCQSQEEIEKQTCPQEAEFCAHSQVVEGRHSGTGSEIDVEDEKVWVFYYAERYMLQANADLLLFYAHTQNFFELFPFASFKSSPIEIYARELGNSVPLSAVDKEIESSPTEGKVSRKDGPKTCKPEDVVAQVTVEYQSDYVLSQLLQWYNGGMGQKAGLPNLSGCVLLPTVDGVWSSRLSKKKPHKPERKTAYETRVRPRLIEWFQDQYKRGDPWPEEVYDAFMPRDSKMDSHVFRFGSPILDFLITGDEHGIHSVLEELDASNGLPCALEGASLAVDQGRPAQAVCRWVQCENEDCLKWRKIPWHVDIDLLPEHFFCKDNQWDPSKRSCDAGQDDWTRDDKIVGVDGQMEVSPLKRGNCPSIEKNFCVGAKFDVLRKIRGVDKYAVARVTHVDLSGSVKRIKFHFLRSSDDDDEWIPFGSKRIAPLHSKTTPTKRKTPEEKAQNSEGKRISKKRKSEGSSKKSSGMKRKAERQDGERRVKDVDDNKERMVAGDEDGDRHAIRPSQDIYRKPDPQWSGNINSLILAASSSGDAGDPPSTNVSAEPDYPSSFCVEQEASPRRENPQDVPHDLEPKSVVSGQDVDGINCLLMLASASTSLENQASSQFPDVMRSHGTSTPTNECNHSSGTHSDATASTQEEQRRVHWESVLSPRHYSVGETDALQALLKAGTRDPHRT